MFDQHFCHPFRMNLLTLKHNPVVSLVLNHRLMALVLPGHKKCEKTYEFFLRKNRSPVPATGNMDFSQQTNRVPRSPSSVIRHPSSFILPPSSFLLHPSSVILRSLSQPVPKKQKQRSRNGKQGEPRSVSSRIRVSNPNANWLTKSPRAYAARLSMFCSSKMNGDGYEWKLRLLRRIRVDLRDILRRIQP